MLGRSPKSRRSRNKKSCPFPSATQAPCSLSCCEPSGTRNSTAVRTVGSRQTVGLSAHGWLVLSPCRWHYSHSKSYVPRPTPAHSSPSPRSQVPRLRSQTSPNPPHPAGPATTCQYLYLTGRGDKTDRLTQARARTHARNCKSPKQAVKAFIYPATTPGQPLSSLPGRHSGTLSGSGKSTQRKTDTSPSSLRTRRGLVYCAALAYSFFFF